MLGPPFEAHIDFIKNIEDIKGLYQNDYYAAFYILAKTKHYLLLSKRDVRDINLTSKFIFMEERRKYVGEDNDTIIQF